MSNHDSHDAQDILPTDQPNISSITPQTPKTEEEFPLGYANVEGASSGGSGPIQTEDIVTQKYRATIRITWGCIIFVIVVWLLDIIISGLSFTVHGITFDFDTTHTTTVIDLLKYVITASLSFYFGSTINKSDS